MVGLCDIHCHLLPEIDDGASSIVETTKLLKLEYADGVRTIIVTPHYRVGMFETSMDEVYKQYARVKEIAAMVGDGMQVFLGCEFHANADMLNVLHRGGRLMAGSQYVLTEFSEKHDYSFMRRQCYELLSGGYKPIVAHAERYPAIRKDIDYLEDLMKLGAYIQMNAGSVLGEEGFLVRQFCKKAIKEGFVHFIASDAHNLTDRRPLLGKCADYLEDLMGETYTRHILVENPKMIIENGITGEEIGNGSGETRGV